MKRAMLSLLMLLPLAGCEQTSSPSKQETWPLVKQCNLHQQACTAEFHGQRITLDISPKPIPVAKPLTVKVDLGSLSAKSVEIDISGHNMYMGYNRVPLKPVDAHHWQGTTMLAFCTRDKMEWYVTLIIDQGKTHQMLVPFYLETHSR